MISTNWMEIDTIGINGKRTEQKITQVTAYQAFNLVNFELGFFDDTNDIIGMKGSFLGDSYSHELILGENINTIETTDFRE
jgi:hypothetical protein